MVLHAEVHPKLLKEFSRLTTVTGKALLIILEDFLDACQSVIVTGRYAGHNRISGKIMSAAAAHVYDLRGGKVYRFRMFADSNRFSVEIYYFFPGDSKKDFIS